jgi:xanthine dehydrogenase/oxidase
MKKKVILNIELPALDENYVLRTFHVLPRAQSTISQVNAAFLIKRSSATAWDLTESPRIVFGGIGARFVHAVATENFLNGKNILDAGVAAQAITTLNGELRPDEIKPGASADYRKKLAVGLFYKFLLGLDPDKVGSLLKWS